MSDARSAFEYPATKVTPDGTPRAQRGEDASAEPSVQDTFSVLADPRRRYALYYLRRNDGVADLDELTAQLLAREQGVDVDEVTPEDFDHVYRSLVHTHLPKLRATNVVEYNLRTGCVVFADAAEAVEDYLRLAERDEGFDRPGE